MKVNQLTYRSLIIIVFVLINAGILFGISQVLAFLNTGADRSQILHLDTAQESYYTPEVIWESTDNPGRPLELFNQTKIEQDYLDAWYASNTAFSSHNKEIITDHYTANARVKLLETLQENMQRQLTVESTTLSHHLSLEMYSADGTLAVLTDRNVKSYQRIFKEGKPQYEGTSLSDYRVILLLEDGIWRIRHIEKINSHKPSQSLPKSKATTTPIAGINYYPQESAWDTFGTQFDIAVIAQDFKIIKDLELNTIRIFVGYEDFGAAAVSQEKLTKLKQLLDTAHQTDLRVIVTLFDFYGDYGVADWTRTQKHLTTIATALKEEPALHSWDIKNEADLDFETRGKSLVTAWTRQMIHSLRAVDPNNPITIGWSSPEVAMTLEQEVDYVSYHYYQDLEGLSQSHSTLNNKTSKSVVLQEIGLSSYHGFWNPLGHSEKDQASFYTKLVAIQKELNIPFLSWTLYDYGEVPSKVAGRYPWRRKKQMQFGLINNEGLLKPSGTVLKER